jgi:hypothetical protein
MNISNSKKLLPDWYPEPKRHSFQCDLLEKIILLYPSLWMVPTPQSRNQAPVFPMEEEWFTAIKEVLHCKCKENYDHVLL